jgi:4-hydroxy-tetrahydrodipicolinate synthase
LLDEFRRGAHGNMPASQITDIHVDIWAKLVAGDEAGARKLYNQVLPLLNFERMHGVATYKEVLYRRGIFTTTLSRAPGKELDDQDRAELDAILADVESMYRL